MNKMIFSRKPIKIRFLDKKIQFQILNQAIIMLMKIIKPKNKKLFKQQVQFAQIKVQIMTSVATFNFK